jgi:hypothetical protein
MNWKLPVICVFACILFIITGLGATEQQLSNAVRRGDLAEVKKYLDLGFSQEFAKSSRSHSTRSSKRGVYRRKELQQSNTRGKSNRKRK